MTTCPRAVIDGKRDCGAKGDDIADPTGKLQSGEQAVFTFENLTSPAIVEKLRETKPERWPAPT